MNLIAAVDKNWAIGKNNDLLYSIKEDMQFFRSTTLNKIVVMGRKTLESFPNAKPLKNRINIVLSSDKNLKIEGATIVNDLQMLFDELKKYDTNEVFVIGGGAIYKMLEPYCDTAYITEINAEKDADIFFPNLSKMEEWKLIESSDKKEDNGIEFVFNKYIRK
ncbi:MAG: dihydrofolate reductase [Ruminococcaceae bacterium]|nr:dihydrofolate reductase [Oscillospiraceae bacterium]